MITSDIMVSNDMMKLLILKWISILIQEDLLENLKDEELFLDFLFITRLIILGRESLKKTQSESHNPLAQISFDLLISFNPDGSSK
jgi:hypothetical protein